MSQERRIVVPTITLAPVSTGKNLSLQVVPVSNLIFPESDNGNPDDLWGNISQLKPYARGMWHLVDFDEVREALKKVTAELNQGNTVTGMPLNVSNDFTADFLKCWFGMPTSSGYQDVAVEIDSTSGSNVISSGQHRIFVAAALPLGLLDSSRPIRMQGIKYLNQHPTVPLTDIPAFI